MTMNLGSDREGTWCVERSFCPSCNLLFFDVVLYAPETGKELIRYFGRPRLALRSLPPSEVPEEFSKDFVEASLVIGDSPKASAALSRRCLQHILREKANVKKQDLAKEIDEILASKLLPAYLSEALDAVRTIGNFAAHPIKTTSTGEIVEVEHGEAEWLLDVIESLFDFYFVQPAVLNSRRANLDAKLASANKPPLKK